MTEPPDAETRTCTRIVRRDVWTKLEPIYESCRSYYGRAHVILYGSLDGCLLKSYDTIVAYADADGRLHRLWNDWSRTTARHVAEFTRQFARRTAPPNKAEWNRMEVMRMSELYDLDRLNTTARATLLLSLAKRPEERTVER